MTNIHPQLKKDGFILGRFVLCHMLLMNDANYPWFILVPDRDGITEIYQLSPYDQVQLLRESSCLGKVLMETFQGDKLNIAALGNVVPQLHMHHIVRYRHDAAWPGPVWGKVPATPYTEAGLAEAIVKLKQGLTQGFDFQV